jgi:glycosyltransferase involved in cell wall biosynthesis
MSHIEDAISALLPVKNGQRYLETLLPNILAMLKEYDELIVVNDGSSDQSQFITEKYRSIDSRVILINTSGIGLVAALNLGISTARNNWVARFDVDDKYLQNRMDEQRKLLRENVSVIFSDYCFISQTDRRLGSIYSAVLPIPTALSLVSGQRTAHPSAVLNRRLLIESGGYQIQDFPAEDLALWLRMSHFGEIISVPLPLLHYTLSNNSISAQNREVQKNKKRELIQSYPSWSSLQVRSITDFEQTLVSYKEVSHTPERILLHLRDIYLVAGLIGGKVPILNLVTKIGFSMSCKIIYAAVKMYFVVFRRRVFRFIY